MTYRDNQRSNFPTVEALRSIYADARAKRKRNMEQDELNLIENVIKEAGKGLEEKARQECTEFKYFWTPCNPLPFNSRDDFAMMIEIIQERCQDFWVHGSFSERYICFEWSLTKPEPGE